MTSPWYFLWKGLVPRICRRLSLWFCLFFFLVCRHVSAFVHIFFSLPCQSLDLFFSILRLRSESYVGQRKGKMKNLEGNVFFRPRHVLSVRMGTLSAHVLRIRTNFRAFLQLLRPRWLTEENREKSLHYFAFVGHVRSNLSVPSCVGGCLFIRDCLPFCLFHFGGLSVLFVFCLVLLLS